MYFLHFFNCKILFQLKNYTKLHLNFVHYQNFFNFHRWTQSGNQKFDPKSIDPDRVSLEIEIGPSLLLVNGALLRHLVHLKENIFGDYQSFTDMQQTRTATVTRSSNRSTKDGKNEQQNASAEASSVCEDEEDDTKSTKPFDPRDYRPLEVTVGLTMHDIQAHLLKNCNDNDPACPVILLDRFAFEMKKGFLETELQLLLSPAIMLLTDGVNRPVKEKHLNQGHMMLSALQVRQISEVIFF